MQLSNAALPPPAPRRLILGVAFALGLAVSLAPQPPLVHAQDTRSAASERAAEKAADKAADKSLDKAADKTLDKVIDKAIDKAASGKSDAEHTADVEAKDGTITFKKGGRTVTITGLPKDKEFDSVDSFARDEPAIAGAVAIVVAIVFLSPVLAIWLILRYRMRKARMLNETMLALAEKGVVAPGEALQAIAAGNVPPPPPAPRAGAAPSAGGLNTLTDQARDIRRRAAWSDLRKGIILGAVGLGITLYGLVSHSHSPNVLGLVLLFVGVGYVALYYFEERKLPPAPPPYAPPAPPAYTPSAAAQPVAPPPAATPPGPTPPPANPGAG